MRFIGEAIPVTLVDGNSSTVNELELGMVSRCEIPAAAFRPLISDAAVTKTSGVPGRRNVVGVIPLGITLASVSGIGLLTTLLGTGLRGKPSQPVCSSR